MFFLRCRGKHNNFDKIKKETSRIFPMRRKNEELHSTQMPSSPQYRHTPSLLMTYIIERCLLFCLFLWQLFFCVCLIWCCLYFPEEKYTQWFFPLSLGKLCIFWRWLKVTSKDWFENKPWQGKSHCLTNFLVAHCCTKVGVFVCSEKQKGLRGHWMIDSLKVTTVMSNCYTSCARRMNNSK